MRTPLLFMVSMLMTFAITAQITINEIDSNTPGTDVAEFVELYSSEPTSLDGYLLVFYNGSDDASYEAFDLTGNMISDGFFVIGNAATPNVDLVFDDNSLQNGADAVALYQAALADFPEDTPITTNGLVDFVAYGTNDSDDPGLISIFGEGCMIQVDEDGNGDDDNQSSARIPDGGTALCPNDFIQQTPSPGESNVPSCFGGNLEFSDGTTEATFCIDDDAIELLNYSVSNNTGDGFIYVITDEDNIIISTTTDEVFDTNLAPEGICRIHGLAYNGTLDQETLSPGEDAPAIATDGDCVSLSTNYLTLNREVCFPDCDGGEISSDAGDNIIVCIDEEEDIFEFSNTSLATEAEYWYVLTDESNFLVGVIAEGQDDLNVLSEGNYRVWGMSYQGDLDIETLDPGDPLFGVSSSNCVDISDGFISIIAQECGAIDGCQTIFFSEYQEGSANNKALEIYNPTQFPVSMSEYRLVNCSNGCDNEGFWDFNNDIFEDAVIAPGGVLSIYHPGADQAILDAGDIEFSFLSNGDDVFALQRISTEEIIDIIGDPIDYQGGGGWTVNGVAGGTQNHTLIRMPQFNEGNPDWSTAQNEWEVLDADVFENLGSHEFIPCSVSSDPIVSFTSSATTVLEEDGVAAFSVSVLNPLDEDMTVEVVISGGTASTDDYMGGDFPTMLTIPAGSDQALESSIVIVDDAIEEGSETIELMLMNPSSGLQIGGGMFTITIGPSDVVIPVLEIADASEVNEEGVAINDDLECELRGVVYGVNLRPSGLQFTLNDPTSGIGVFNASGDLGYTVTEGDSIHVVGVISQFNGLTQINPESIEFISSGNQLNDPTTVTQLGENTESQLIKIECVELVDPTQWSNDGGWFAADVTDGTNTFTAFIDADTDVFGTSAPEGSFTLIGIGGQFDNSPPFDEGYQIIPRYMADVLSGPEFGFTAEFAEEDVTDQINGGVLLLGDLVSDFLIFTADNTDLEYDWLVDGEAYSGSEINIPLGTVQTWVDSGDITVTVSGMSGACSVTQSFEFEVMFSDNIDEIENLQELVLYPNPTDFEITIDLPTKGGLSIVNQIGKEVLRQTSINAGQNTLDVSELSAGVYFLLFRAENRIYRAQFIKK